MSKKIDITVSLTEEQAAALARFVKHAGFHEPEMNAMGEQEARQMAYGLNAVQEGLAKAGFAPR